MISARYKQFIFEDYVFNEAHKTVTLHYSFDGIKRFVETYRFDFKFTQYDPVALDRALQSLFLMAGVSYYKAFLPPEILIKRGSLDDLGAKFFGKTYQRGLGELFYVNKLDPSTPVEFPITVNQPDNITDNISRTGVLIGIGGGKDSLVSVELLRGDIENLATWSLNHRPQFTPLIERIGLPHYWVEREWDQQLFDLKDSPDAYNGHIPISAMFACVGSVVAVLSGRKDVVVSNEQSASELTLQYLGVAINHQYSKSIEFEKDYQAYLNHTLGESQRYFSFLRPLSEVRIAEIFARVGFEKYRDVFSSCNRAYVHGSQQLFWDGTCSKCAFVFLALTPFVPRAQLEALLNGKNILLDKDLEPTYRQLLGTEGDRPLECVGDIKESRVAMHLSQQQYPELNRYQFELPADYDYKQLGSHEMPPEYYKILEAAASS